MKEQIKLIIYFLGANMLLLSFFLMPEPSHTYWDVRGETISVFWLFWLFLQAFYPIIIFIEFVGLLLLLFPSRPWISHSKGIGGKL